MTLVEVELVTGRTHQIRVHFLFRHHPLVGDPAYGGRVIPELDSKGMDRQALHATRLEFVHPSSGRLMKFESPLPEDFAALLHKVGV